MFGCCKSIISLFITGAVKAFQCFELVNFATNFIKTNVTSFFLSEMTHTIADKIINCLIMAASFILMFQGGDTPYFPYNF